MVKSAFNFSLPTRLLLCGHTGCGKSTLLAKMRFDLYRQYGDNLKFIIADFKKIDWVGLTFPSMLYPVITDAGKMDNIIDKLFSSKKNNPIVIIWDVFDEYLALGEEHIKNFRRLLESALKQNITVLAASSRVDHSGEYLALFDHILVGNCNIVSRSDFPLWFKEQLLLSPIKTEDLDLGHFLHFYHRKLHPGIIKTRS